MHWLHGLGLVLAQFALLIALCSKVTLLEILIYFWKTKHRINLGPKILKVNGQYLNNSVLWVNEMSIDWMAWWRKIILNKWKRVRQDVDCGNPYFNCTQLSNWENPNQLAVRQRESTHWTVLLTLCSPTQTMNFNGMSQTHAKANQSIDGWQ